VLLGYFAGNSYQRVEKTVGRDVALIAAGLVVIAFIVWRLRRRRERDGA
jgi:membrane protein DedA with SNARE-associated domain